MIDHSHKPDCPEQRQLIAQALDILDNPNASPDARLHIRVQRIGGELVAGCPGGLGVTATGRDFESLMRNIEITLRQTNSIIESAAGEGA